MKAMCFHRNRQGCYSLRLFDTKSCGTLQCVLQSIKYCVEMNWNGLTVTVLSSGVSGFVVQVIENDDGTRSLLIRTKAGLLLVYEDNVVETGIS